MGVAPGTGNCNDHWEDILGAMEWSRTNSSLHEALSHVDWSREAIIGHSFGSAHGLAAAKFALDNPEQYSVKAVVASHGHNDCASEITIPAMFTSGHEDRRSQMLSAFQSCPATHKVYAVASGAGHMEPTHGGRLNPFDAHFLGCHAAGLQSSCNKIYGNSEDTICNAYVQSCVVVPAPPPPPIPITCSTTDDWDCSGDFYREIQVDRSGDCCDLCKADAQCSAWTHSIWNDRGKHVPTCYLKTACGDGYTLQGVTSGTMERPTCDIQEKTDCGGDFYAARQVEDYSACCDLCRADTGCMAWTHSQWDDGGKRNPTCYLKKACGSPSSSDDCTSGTVSRFRNFFVVA